MSWDARQTAMLQAMGLGSWPSMSMESVPMRRAPFASEVRPSVTPEQGPAKLEHAADTPSALPSPEPTLSARTWADLESVHTAVRECRACGLCEHRKQAVPGVGHAHAEWMVVGEAPGEQEDERGEPFVGASGQLLDEMLAVLGRSRKPGAAQQQVFITNTVKCRPPGNRNPAPEELAACGGFLQAQIELVKPRMILALGRFAAQSLLREESPVGRLRGRVHALAGGTPVVVSYHPSYLLRQPLEKARAWEDLCLAMDVAAAKGQGS